MIRTHLWSIAVVFTAVLAMQVASTVAQEGERAPRGDGERRRQADPEQRRQRMEQGRARMATAMKDRLKATDEEWAIIRPRLDKVTELRGRTFGGFGGRGGPAAPGADRNRPGAGNEAQPQREQTELSQRTRELNELVASETASPDAIKAALQKLRDARAKQEQEIKTARESLREVLSLRQEATLVSMGLLD